MKRVALVANRLTVGGLERVVLELARGLGRYGWEPHVLCLEAGGAYADEIRAAGVPVEVLGCPVGWSARALPGVLGWLARVRPAVVQTHLFASQVFAGAAARVLGVRGIVHVEQNFYRWKGAAARVAERAALGKRGVVVTPTRVLADHHRARLGVGARQLRVIPNGVAAPARLAGARERLGARASDVLIGLAERLVPAKRQDVWMAAARRAARVEPRLRFALIGDGPERAALARRAAEGPLRGRVALVGEVAQAAPLLGALDVYATASTMEGFGIAPVEALAHGVPVVAPATAVFRETLGGTRAADLTAPDSVEDLAAAMIRLARAPHRRRRMGAAGVAAVRERWALEAMTSAYATLYDGLTSAVASPKFQG